MRYPKCPKCGWHIVSTMEYQTHGTVSAFVRRFKCQRCGTEVQRPETIATYNSALVPKPVKIVKANIFDIAKGGAELVCKIGAERQAVTPADSHIKP